MIRKAFLMFIHPEAHAEYERRHRPIPEELADVLRTHGVHNYSIHLDEKRHLLFAYAEIESEEKWAAIASMEACRKWWVHMSDLMPGNPDHSPVSENLREVFYLD